MLKSFISRFQNPYPIPRTISILSFPFSSPRTNDSDSDSGFIVNKDHDTPPKLFVVQPRLRPDSLLRLKLSEALNLANSLEEKREDGSHSAKCEFKKNDEGIPNYLVVQNPSSKSLKAEGKSEDGSHSTQREFKKNDEGIPNHLVVQNPSTKSLEADKFFGPGTVEKIKCHIKAFESQEEIDAVFVNTILSGIQQRNLEMAWKKPVMDRVGLIIEIFHAHAETKEAKLQSELAALMYKRSRLVRVRGPSGRLTFGTSGDAEVVSARGRGSGGRGFISGAGETELQLQRRRIQERKTYLLSQIEEVRRTRAVQRSARKRHGSSYGKDLSTVAIVGYTNAGKSTLVSTLSGTDVYSDDRLFATVDPRLRSVILPSGRKALLSDTVGFISDLPVQLVEAFHATLEEVVEADLLVHVLDASAPNMDDQRATVLEVLEQIGVTEEKMQNMVEVWNKIDLIDEDKRTEETPEEGEHLIECEDQTVSEDTSLNVSEEANIDTVLEDEDESSNDEEQTNTERVLRDDEFINGKHQNTAKCIDVKEVEHVKTSAVMRIGLQELLEVIDDKLNKQQSVVTKSCGPFDRKWRASYTAENEKVASE